MDKWRKNPPARRAEVKPRNSAHSGGIRNEYLIRVCSPGGKAIPDALVLFSSYDDNTPDINEQVVATDRRREFHNRRGLLRRSARELLQKRSAAALARYPRLRGWPRSV